MAQTKTIKCLFDDTTNEERLLSDLFSNLDISEDIEIDKNFPEYNKIFSITITVEAIA